VPNILKVTVENPDEILNTGAYAAGALIRVQTATTETGTFGDVTGTGSTPTIAVVSGTRIYTGYDPAGIVSSWYRTRYENAGGTRLSDWTPAFQVGDETAGLLCSIYDVKQELGIPASDTTQDEIILEKIGQVSASIELYVGRWLAPRPTNPASDTTLLFDVPWQRGATRSLLLDYGNRLTGIRRLTSIGIATVSQPESGGSYTAGTVADFLLRPRPNADGPALRLEISPYPTGVGFFFSGYNTVQIVGGFGPASVPAAIQGVALRATVRRYIGKGGGGVAVTIGPSGNEILLPDISGADRATLDAYRIPNVQ
jgi:hypothetical protein